MIEPHEPRTVLVVDGRMLIVSIEPATAPLEALLRIDVDGQPAWSSTEPAWRPLAFGASDGVAYVWSARRVLALAAGVVREVATSSEDIIAAFPFASGWLLVCETSVLLPPRGRLELGAVAVRASMDGARLRVVDDSGTACEITVEGGRLVLSA